MEGKNKIIVYRDWIEIFEPLEDAEAGKLIKHFFRYVNDQNPESPDRLTGLLFDGSIKPTLKRDLQSWKQQQERNKINGSNGGRPKKEKPKETEITQSVILEPTQTEQNPKKGVKDNVKVNDNVNDILLEKETKFNFKKSLIDLGVEEQIASDWMAVRRKKKATNSETAFKGLLNEIKISGRPANDCIKIAVERSWAGFKNEWLKTETNGSKPTHAEQREQAMRDYLNR